VENFKRQTPLPKLCFGINGMQGRKRFEPQLFYDTSLEKLVPEDNF